MFHVKQFKAMKKDLSIHYHLDNLVEFADVLRTDFEDNKTYYFYPVFWYDYDMNRAYLSICITNTPNSFDNSTTIFPPVVDKQVDLYIQFGRIMEMVKESLSIFNIQAIEYKEA